MTRNTYDPGKPGVIRSCGHGQFEVESFREPGHFYLTDLAARTCSCEHHRRTAAFCKHLQSCEAASFQSALRVAKGLDVADLHRELNRPGRRPEQKAAILHVLNVRAERLVNGGGF